MLQHNSPALPSVEITTLFPGAKLPDQTKEPISIYSYSTSNDGRVRHSLVPPRDIRELRTGLHFTLPVLGPILWLRTPPALGQRLEVLGWNQDSDGEFLVKMTNYGHESALLPHHTHIADLYLIVSTAYLGGLKDGQRS